MLHAVDGPVEPIYASRPHVHQLPSPSPDPPQSRADFPLHKTISLLSIFKSRATLSLARFANLERRHSVALLMPVVCLEIG